MNQEISDEIDRWIAKEELPTRPGLKAISRFDDLFPEDVYERKAYWDFQKWGFEYDHLVIKAIRKDKEDRLKKDFWEGWRT